MASFRFETQENVITKHTLNKLNWTQAAQWAAMANTDSKHWTLASVRQPDANTLVIVKRKDINKSLCYKMGFDQHDVYERVTINRGDHTVTRDRMDINWLDDAPFIGKRDLFMPSKRHEGNIDFVRQHYWLMKWNKPCEVIQSNFAAWNYRRLIKKQEGVKERKQ